MKKELVISIKNLKDHDMQKVLDQGMFPHMSSY